MPFALISEVEEIRINYDEKTCKLPELIKVNAEG
jgi:hypothetical protein